MAGASGTQYFAPAGYRLLEGLFRLQGQTRGDRQVLIAVLDGPVALPQHGFDRQHMTVDSAFARPSGAGGPALAHGTHVASQIFGTHDDPLIGLARQCRGVVIPIFAGRAGGQLEACSEVEPGHAIQRAVGIGARVINISSGALADANRASHYLRRAARNAVDAGGGEPQPIFVLGQLHHEFVSEARRDGPTLEMKRQTAVLIDLFSGRGKAGTRHRPRPRGSRIVMRRPSLLRSGSPPDFRATSLSPLSSALARPAFVPAGWPLCPST
jgi:hypothetical protein